jgi:hypothetical protein
MATGLWGADAALRAVVKQAQAQSQDAIVTVRLVIVKRFILAGRESQKDESKTEVTGTVVDPSGLTVLSNWASDPMANAMEMSFSTGGEKMDVKMESDVTEVKIVAADGAEIPAQLVLKDKDLDLVFVRPKEKQEKSFACLNFAAAPEPEVLDEIFSLARLGREVNRVVAVSTGAICALVRKPRTFYVTDLASGFMNTGCPVFNAKGQTLGLAVIRQNPVKGMSHGLIGGMQPVILPAADLLEVIQQAHTAKPAEKKSGSKGDPKAGDF